MKQQQSFIATAAVAVVAIVTFITSIILSH